jgi:histidine phosphotransferase ChpT
MPKNRVKLLLNLLVVAVSCIPRGGSIDCVIEGDADYPTFRITASGKAARIPHGVEASLAGAPEGGTVDAHGIQPFYSGMVARASDMGVSLVIGEEHVRIVSQRMTAKVNAAA